MSTSSLSHSQAHCPVGGRLKLYYGNWCKITSDEFILSAVRGYKIEFDPELMPPIRGKPLFEYKRNEMEKQTIQNEIEKLIDKQVIEICEHEEDEFISNIFTRPKKNGGLRVILDLSELNKSMLYQHFKMDSIHTAIPLLSPSCYLASVDLQDAYYTVSVHPSHRKYLKFIWQGQLYQYKVLPNGLSTAPRLFTKLLKPVFATLRKEGHIVVGYLDDTLIIGECSAQTKQAVKATTAIFSDLGFLVHPDKSVLEPTQQIKFLGFTLDSQNMTISLPEEKKAEIIEECTKLLGTHSPSIRSVARVIGKLIAAFPAIQYGPLHYRSLERDKICSLKENRGHFDRAMQLSEKAKQELTWWIDNIKESDSPLQRKGPQIELRTDASGSGWGATDLHTNIGGRWDENELVRARNNEINYLETLAAGLGLKAFCADMHDSHILIRIDNTTAVAYLNNMGGIKSKDCDEMAMEIWEWCANRNIWITAEHLPGRLNTVADCMSRKFNEKKEWMLDKQAFENIVRHFGVPEIDLFASRLNAQLPRFISWLPDPEAETVNAFTVNWGPLKFYAFPPFCLISKCLSKVMTDKATGLLVVPNWPTQPWYPILQKLTVGRPLVLKKRQDLLKLPVSDAVHPLNKSLDLLCCRICGDRSSTKV